MPLCSLQHRGRLGEVTAASGELHRCHQVKDPRRGPEQLLAAKGLVDDFRYC